jgi:RsbT co-antagonist protein rsbRD N-terminal domain
MTNTILARSKNHGTHPVNTESVAEILERESGALIHDWMGLVEKQEDLMTITLGYEDRTGHLPKLLRDVISRLRLKAGTKAPISIASSDHGDLRRQQGYSVAMVVEESRLLQVCLFTTLHKNTNRLEYSRLLPDVVTIADEVDAQLKQQMLRYMAADAVVINKPDAD